LAFLDNEEEELRKLLSELDEGTSIGLESLMMFIARAMGVEEGKGDGGTTAGTEREKSGEGEHAEFPSTSKEVLHSPELCLESTHESIKPVCTGASRSRSTIAESGTASAASPSTPKTLSVFDARQRSTPLEAPSSWHLRPIPAYKKRRSSSSVGNVGWADNDTEVSPTDNFSPKVLGRLSILLSCGVVLVMNRIRRFLHLREDIVYVDNRILHLPRNNF
jgi:hypothetical protein